MKRFTLVVSIIVVALVLCFAVQVFAQEIRGLPPVEILAKYGISTQPTLAGATNITYIESSDNDFGVEILYVTFRHSDHNAVLKSIRTWLIGERWSFGHITDDDDDEFAMESEMVFVKEGRHVYLDRVDSNRIRITISPTSLDMG